MFKNLTLFGTSLTFIKTAPKEDLIEFLYLKVAALNK
jgi:hypothetical protein